MVAPTGIDFSPLVPVINGMITAAAGILSAATPVLIGYAIMWLRNHGIQASQAAQQIVVDRINATIANAQKYATTAADDGVSKLKITVDDPTIAKAANYAIVQSPALFKKLGFDPATEDGQKAIVRMVTARSALPTQAQVPQSDVHVDVKPTIEEPKP